MKNKLMEQVGETFLDYFKKNKGVYSHNDVEKIVDQAILNERQRIIELITKYDLIPPQVKMESPRYWKGYEDTVNIILEKLTQRIYEKNKYD